MQKKFKRLNKKFFAKHPKLVAPKLLGKYIIRILPEGKIIAEIVETEAYAGKEDKACHIGRFGRTKRTEILFSEPGSIYVYAVHINMFCFNIVAHRKKEGGGVLIRALKPICGKEIIIKNLGYNKKNLIDETKLLNGPAKICKALKIDTSLNGTNILKSKEFYITTGERVNKKDIISTSRINIPYAGISKNWKWRFLIKDCEYVSK